MKIKLFIFELASDILYFSQLPSSANWAKQQQAGSSGPSRSLAEIQQEEHELEQIREVS